MNILGYLFGGKKNDDEKTENILSGIPTATITEEPTYTVVKPEEESRRVGAEPYSEESDIYLFDEIIKNVSDKELKFIREFVKDKGSKKVGKHGTIYFSFIKGRKMKDLNIKKNIAKYRSYILDRLKNRAEKQLKQNIDDYPEEEEYYRNKYEKYMKNLEKILEDDKEFANEALEKGIVSRDMYKSFPPSTIFRYLAEHPWKDEEIAVFKITYIVKVHGMNSVQSHVIRDVESVEEAIDQFLKYLYLKYDENDLVSIVDVHITLPGENRKYMSRLRAFGSVCSRKYQDLLASSMCIDGKNDCIYQSYLTISGKMIPPKGTKTKSLRLMINSKLKDEEEIVKAFVKNGEIHEFIKYVSKRDNKDYFLIMYTIGEIIQYEKNGNVNKIDFAELKDLVDKNDIDFCFAYQNNHVGPHKLIRVIKEIEKSQKIEFKSKNMNSQYPVIDPIKDTVLRKNIKRKLHFYDIESYKNGDLGVLCSVTESRCAKTGLRKFVSKVFTSAELFAKYVDSLSHKNITKTRPKNKIQYHSFYAHNGSNYDSLYIFRELNRMCRLSKFIDSGNSIKGFTYGTNVNFRDSLLMIQGSLSVLVNKVFKLKIKASELPEGLNYYNYPDDHEISSKEVYPYTFYSPETEDYEGEVPEAKYFGSSYDTMEERIKAREYCVSEHKKYNRVFNLKEYTIYYCVLDCILGYKMLKKYEEESQDRDIINDISEDEALLIKRALFPFLRNKKANYCQVCKHKHGKSIADTCKNYDKCFDNYADYITKKPEFLDCVPTDVKNENNIKNSLAKDELLLKETYLNYIRKRIHFNPFDYHTKSSMTVAKFKKLYNLHTLWGIPAKYKEMMDRSYKGGVTDVFKRKYEHELRFDIELAYKKFIKSVNSVDFDYPNLNERQKKIIINKKQQLFNDYMNKIVSSTKFIKIHKDDINSSYPKVMTGNIPYRFVKYHEKSLKIKGIKSTLVLSTAARGRNPVSKKKFIDTYLYVVSYKYKDPKWIPNIYCHFDDKFVGLRCGEEYVWGNILNQAVEQHRKNDIKHHGCSPQFDYLNVHGYFQFRSDSVFNNYITSLYKKRCIIKKKLSKLYGFTNDPTIKIEKHETASNLEIRSKTIKDLMNCLYGKFGQRIFGKTLLCNVDEYRKLAKNKGHVITDLKVIPAGLDEENKFEDLYIVSLDDKSEEKRAIGNLNFIASYITAGARKNLFEMVYEAGAKNVYYVDTDSCYYEGNRIGKIDPGKLGWRDSEIDENKECDNVIITCAVFNAPKFYGARGFIKSVAKFDSDIHPEWTHYEKHPEYNEIQIKDAKKVREKWVKMKDKLKSKGVRKGLIKFEQFEELNNGKIESIETPSIQFNRKMLDGKVITTKGVKLTKCVLTKRSFNGNNSNMLNGK